MKCNFFLIPPCIILKTYQIRYQTYHPTWWYKSQTWYIFLHQNGIMEGCVFFPQESIYSVECDIFSCYTICVLGGHLPALEEHLKSEVKTISVIITISPDDSSTPISHGIFERRTIPKCADTYTHGIFIAFSNGFMKTGHENQNFEDFSSPPKNGFIFSLVRH